MPGTFAATPESAGMFYQWNRKIGWSATDPMINSEGDDTWDDSMPVGDEWETANDPSPAGFRVPTLAEIQTLFETDKVSYEWTTLNSINGGKFTDISTGNSIFLPATGCRDFIDGLLAHVGSCSYFWSSTVHSTASVYCMLVADSIFGWDYWHGDDGGRSYGFCVRAVAE